MAERRPPAAFARAHLLAELADWQAVAVGASLSALLLLVGIGSGTGLRSKIGGGLSAARHPVLESRLLCFPGSHPTLRRYELGPQGPRLSGRPVLQKRKRTDPRSGGGLNGSPTSTPVSSAVPHWKLLRTRPPPTKSANSIYGLPNMPERPSLAEALRPVADAKPTSAKPRDRRGKRGIVTYVETETARCIKMLHPQAYDRRFATVHREQQLWGDQALQRAGVGVVCAHSLFLCMLMARKSLADRGGIFPGPPTSAIYPSSPPPHLPAAGSRGLRPWATVAEKDTSTHSLFTALNHHHPLHTHALREQRSSALEGH